MGRGDRNHFEVVEDILPGVRPASKALRQRRSLERRLPLLVKRRRYVLQRKPRRHKLNLLLIAPKAFADNSAIQTKSAVKPHIRIIALLLLNIRHLEEALEVFDGQVRQESDLVQINAIQIVKRVGQFEVEVCKFLLDLLTKLQICSLKLLLLPALHGHEIFVNQRECVAL